jgi:hypothetical protein
MAGEVGPGITVRTSRVRRGRALDRHPDPLRGRAGRAAHLVRPGPDGHRVDDADLGLHRPALADRAAVGQPPTPRPALTHTAPPAPGNQSAGGAAHAPRGRSATSSRRPAGSDGPHQWIRAPLRLRTRLRKCCQPSRAATSAWSLTADESREVSRARLRRTRDVRADGHRPCAAGEASLGEPGSPIGSASPSLRWTRPDLIRQSAGSPHLTAMSAGYRRGVLPAGCAALCRGAAQPSD